MSEPALAMPAPALDPADIPVVILCGGMGTRLREASEKLPKPLVDIGGPADPLARHEDLRPPRLPQVRPVPGLQERADQAVLPRDARADRRLHAAPRRRPRAAVPRRTCRRGWEITFAETGLLTGTGGRIKKAAQYIDSDVFALTYSDGVGNVDLTAQLQHHLDYGRTATVTGVHPTSRFGEIHVDPDKAQVVEFNEKPTLATGWVSGGFFLMNRSFLDDYVSDDPGVLLEKEPLQQVARDGQLTIFPHEGFWAGMDTFRDWTDLNKMWDDGEAPWKVWQ
jgi:glucose-1-phosphate cytidylyltransferase